MNIKHFTHPSVDGYLGLFCFLAIVNNVAINMNVQVCLWHVNLDLFRYVLKSGVTGSYGGSILRTFHIAFHTEYVSSHSQSNG